MLKSCCESSLSEDIGQCYFLLLQVYCLSSSLKEVFLARHAIFCFEHNSLVSFAAVVVSLGALPDESKQRLRRRLTIHGLDHDLMQLLKSLKTSDTKMVMYNIASNLNGIFRRIGKAT